MAFLTEKDNEMIAHFHSLDKKGKKQYLKENNMIILAEHKEEKSKDVLLDIEFNKLFYKKLMTLKLEDETEETCISRLLKESITLMGKELKKNGKTSK